jgi:hypothetical protein
MRQLTPTTTTPSIHPSLDRYLLSMTGRCPYLGPSIRAGLTTWSAYQADETDAPDLLGLLIGSAEEVRAGRREHGPLVCHNIAIVGPTDILSAQAVLDWPHWIARNLYAPVGLMIGKFWVGEREDDKYGRAIMPPPVSYFSTRHSYPAKDARFLRRLPAVAAALAAAVDDGRNVLTAHLGRPGTPADAVAAYDTLRTRFPAPTCASGTLAA